MNTGTMNSLNTIIRTNDTGQAQLTRFIESPEIKMFIHDLRHLVQAIVGSVDTLQMALQEHAADLAAKSLDRLRQNTDLAVDMLGHFGANPQVRTSAETKWNNRTPKSIITYNCRDTQNRFKKTAIEPSS